MMSRTEVVNESGPIQADSRGRTPSGDPPPDDHRDTRYGTLLALCSNLDSPVTIDQLADPMFQWECGSDGSSREKNWFDVHEELYLVDLPTLERVGVLEFDRERGLVSATEKNEKLDA